MFVKVIQILKKVNKQKLEKIKQKFSENARIIWFFKEMECIANEIIEISDHQYNLNYKGNANLYDIKNWKISYNYGKETEQLFQKENWNIDRQFIIITIKQINSRNVIIIILKFGNFVKTLMNCYLKNPFWKWQIFSNPRY